MAENPTFLTADGREIDAWGRSVQREQKQPEAEPQTTGPGYDGMTSDELKAELKRRQDEGRQFDTASIKKKSDLIDALKADDEAAGGDS